MLTMLAGFFAKSMLMQSPVGGFLKRIPKAGWIALAIGLAVIAGLIWHHRAVGKHDAELTAKVTAQVNARWEKATEDLRQKAIKLAAKANATSRTITTKLKGQHDEEVRNIGRRADGQRLRGPGAAALNCGPGNPAGLSSGAGRHVEGSAVADAGRPGLPAEDRAAVPWPWLVGRGASCDVSRAENLTWRQWHAQQAAAWEAYRQQLQKAADQAKGKPPNGR
jgi:hypothetical protein